MQKDGKKVKLKLYQSKGVSAYGISKYSANFHVLACMIEGQQ